MLKGEVCRACAPHGRRILGSRAARRFALLTFTAVEMLLLLACLARPAHAYVDPGTGLLAMQVGGSMLAAALLTMRSKVRKLLGIAPRGGKDPETQDEGSVAS